MAAQQGPISLKPNKLEGLDSKRDFLIVNTWIYKLEQYLALVQISNNVQLSDSNRIMYASSFFNGTAAVWWYTVIQANHVPTTWQAFKDLLVKEFVPADHVHRSREKLRKLKQTASVAKYLAEFRNSILTIPDMGDGEKWDRFCSGLKHDVRIEVMKSTVTTFEEASQIALRVDSALWAATQAYPASSSAGGLSNNPVPMEIGNAAGGPRRFDPRREADYRENRCFKCHKIGCRPWKHHEKRASINHVGLKEGLIYEKSTEEDEGDSEN